jgi:DNA-binding response OmpR family regulator
MSGRQLTILLAGDHPGGFESLLSYLQSEGFKVIPVENRDSIVTMTRSMVPDLILLDLKSCFDICRQLKRNFVTQPIPIIALLTQADETDRIVVMELGADDCLGKPYNLRELILRIRSSLIRAWERKGKVRYDQAKHYNALFRSSSPNPPTKDGKKDLGLD